MSKSRLARAWAVGSMVVALWAATIAGCGSEDACSTCGQGAFDAEVTQEGGAQGDASVGEDGQPDQDGAADAAAGDATEAGVADGADTDQPAPGDAAVDGVSADAPAAELGTISVQELHDALAAKSFLLINVHVPYQGEIAGTDTNISYLDPEGVAGYVGAELDTQVVVYCMSNYMSTIAGQDLVERGYRGVRYLDGGMSAWTAAGYPLENVP